MRRRAAIAALLGVTGLLTAVGGCTRGTRRDARAPGARDAAQSAAGGEVTGADETGRVVRVALVVGATAVAVSAAGGEWRLYDASGRRALARGRDGAAWTVERRGAALRAVGPDGASDWTAGPLVARAVGAGAQLVHDGRRWRGELLLHAAAGGGVTVVNHVPVEEYLRGVVPLELSTGAVADAAALQAQAVAARSYTYSRLAEFLPRDAAVARAHQPFDLRSTVADQVYGGVNAERAVADQAIRATTGLVLRHEGAVASAPYHSACGGTTAAPDEVWNGPGPAYLRPVSDRVPGARDRSYCELAPRHRWVREYDAATLHAVLERYLRRYARGGASDAGAAAGGGIGVVRALDVGARTTSGRVGTLVVRTDAGRFVLRGNDIRFALRTLGGEILASTYFSIDAGTDADGRLARVTFRGQGNGHGIGMCQWGAMGRSRAGQDFRTILRTYYPGTTIEPAE
jgi:stage II sporulation protein D